jgi:lipid-A-disaccharide synthase
MHLFFSVGEPSGDQHASHLIQELRRRQPGLEVSGYGGPLMEQAGCRLQYRLTELAVMGILPVLPLLGRFYQLVRQARRFFQENRPDAVILVDFPGFNWWIARQAKAAGIPVFYYFPPQLWAWASWRVRRIRQYVDHVLCTLPFEKAWYAERGIQVEYVGHPIFDEVARQELDSGFGRDWAAGEGARVGLLPGSRNREVTQNWPIMLEVVRRLHSQNPGAHFLVACYKEAHRRWCREQLQLTDRGLPLHFFVGKTPEIIALADCCLMVSGSVSLEVLARATPAAVLYRASRPVYVIARMLISCPYLSLPNLMAGREILPEFYCIGNPEPDIQRMTALLHSWLTYPAGRARVRKDLADLRQQVAQPGAVAHTAEAILKRLEVVEAERAA